MLEGGLSYDPLATRYFINEKPEGMQMRNLRLKSDFLVPVMVINVSLAPEAQNYFQVYSFRLFEKYINNNLHFLVKQF